LREVGRNDDAIRAYDSMLDDEPRDVEVLERKKDALIAKGDHEGIIAIYDVLLQIDPLSKSAHVDRGDALSSIGRLDDAAAEYQYALRVDPSDRSVMNRLGLTLMQLEQYSRAAQVFDQGWNLDPSDLIMLDNKRRALLMGKDPAGALAAFDQAVKADPSNASFHMDRGRALATQGRYGEAMKALDKAIELDPQNGEVWKYKGNVHFKEGDKAKAVNCYAKAIELGAVTATLLRSKGRAEEDLGRLDDAYDSYVRAAEIEGDDPILWMRIGIVQAKLGKVEEAVRSLERSIGLDSTNNRAWLNQAALLEKLGEDEEALRCFDTVLANEPQDKFAWSGKGRILMRMDKLDQAKRALDRALEIDPSLPSAQESMAVLMQKLKERDVSIYAAKVLEFEYRQNRRVTREEAFKECGLPFAYIDAVTEYLQSRETVDIDSLDDDQFQAYEELSRDVLLATLGNPNYTRQGLRLAETYMCMPDRDVQKAKKVLAYIQAVNAMDFPEETPDKRTEKLLREAMSLPAGSRSTLGLMENLNIGIYTARRLVSMMDAIEAPVVSVDRSPPMARARAQPSVEANAPVADASMEGTAWAPPNLRETEEMGLFRNRRKAEADPPKADRSKAITVKYYPNTDRYNRRNCIFHGEPAVTVCPNCGTLFCMECTKVLECPRCHTPLNFVDGSIEPVDDSDVIETEAQRLAIQKRWAQRRMAEAQGLTSKSKAGHGPTSRDAMAERAIKIAEKVMKSDRPVEPTIQTFQSSSAAEPAAPRQRQAERSASTPKRRGASSLVAAALAYQPPAPAEGTAMEEPVPEEIVPQEKEEKDKLDKIRELLEQPDKEEGGATRDLSRL